MHIFIASQCKVYNDFVMRVRGLIFFNVELVLFTVAEACISVKQERHLANHLHSPGDSYPESVLVSCMNSHSSIA